MFRVLCVVVTLLFSSLGSSQDAPALSSADKQAVENVLAEYVQAFIAKDYVKLRDCLQAPFVRLAADGKPAVVTTLDGVIALYHNMRDPLDQKGYANSKPKGEARISILAPDLVLVNRAYTRYKGDGSLLQEVSSFYLVSKSSGKWKITGLIRQEAAFAGKVY